MRVNMDVVQRRAKIGMFKSQDVAEVILNAEFTEEEKHKIKKLGIGDYTFFKRPCLQRDTQGQKILGPEGYTIKVKNPVKGEWAPLHYENLLEANQAINELEQQVRNLKNHLEGAEPERRSFEL